MRTLSRHKSSVTTAREWVVITGDSESRLEEITKQDLVQRTGLSTRDLRVVDPVLSYPSSILGRERAIVVNLEHIKAIVTASEVLLSNSRDPLVEPVLRELESRLAGDTHRGSRDSTNDAPRGGTTKPLPFEFRALELCLELASRRLEIETSAIEKEAYPALDELMHNVSTLNLERVRQIKSRLVGISGRVQKIRNELEHLLDDDVDMASLHLSEKLVYQATVGKASRFDFYKQPPQSDEESDGDYDIESELQEEDDENESEIGFRPNLDELEMLLEAYFVQSEGISNKLTTLREYVDDTEDYINIMLDDKQNQLLEMGVMLGTATMIISIGIMIVGILSMNIHISLFDVPPSMTFWEIAGGLLGGIVGLYIIILAYYKRRKLL
ncbi:magnesium transporter MRS2-F-like protein [Carex littledalei]|uniref:Magnesium transporter n=1 Tax=Carex littledalei TaxID=544730 RepID=A0A833R371_9POAL|nr:magnesium transporter MRS2-F-like protein [Carex littledalei]